MTRRAVCLALLAVSTATASAQNPPPAAPETHGSRVITAPITQAAPTLPIGKIKLLSHGVGWVSVYRRLLMTTDSGGHWHDITPLPPMDPFNPHDDAPASTFFLNPNSGWVLYAHSDETDEGDLLWTFYTERTRDGGATWNRFDLPNPPCEPAKEACRLGQGDLTFADELHGWTSLDSALTAFGSSELLYTGDGGKTWKNVKAGTDGFIDSMDPAGPSTLWMTASGEIDYAFGVTRDRGATFQPVTLPNPPGLTPSYLPSHETPIFANPRDGYEAVWYSNIQGDNWTGVLFATHDGGRTWRADRTLSGVHGGTLRSQVVGGIWIVPLMRNGEHYPSLLELPAHQKATAPDGSHGDARCGISFLSPVEGWSHCFDRLYSTADGGTTWKDITPTSAALSHPNSR